MSMGLAMASVLCTTGLCKKIDDWAFTFEKEPNIRDSRYSSNSDSNSGSLAQSIIWNHYYFYITILVILSIIFGIGLLLIRRNVRLKIPIINLNLSKIKKNGSSSTDNGTTSSNMNDKKYYSNATLKKGLRCGCGITIILIFVLFCMGSLLGVTQHSGRIHDYGRRFASMQTMNKKTGMGAWTPNRAESAIMSDRTIGLSVGGAKDINNFRENIKQGYLPQKTDVTIEGIFYDYYFDTGMPSSSQDQCQYLFCPSYTQG